MSETTGVARAAGAGRYKPYPAYKDSGVEWLGEIPAHWEVKPLKRALDSGNADGSLIKGRMHQEPGEGLFPGFSASGQDIWVEEAQHHEPGIVLSAVGARCGKTFKADGHWTAVANTHVVFPHGGFDRDFLWYLTNDENFWDRGGTAQPFVRVAATLQRPWCFPSLDEQRAIAAFLDRETARIDALVAKKERLIALLQEQRTALITRAVTKGLDPTVPMKDSGVEWLGEIPAHWEVEENRWLFRESDVRSQLGAEELLTVSHITGVTRRSEKPDVTMIEAESHEGYKICGNRELAINTMWAWMGALGIAREHGMVSPSYNVYRIAHTGLVPQYYDYLCRIPLHVAEIIRHSKGIWQSRLRLYPDAFREIMTPVPPRDEQDAIAAFLDRETARIDALVAKVHDAIERLKELRTALISAAVTGKIDVREEASLDGTQVTQ